MTEEEIMSYVFEDILPGIKKELKIKDYKNLNELCQSAQLVETALKILPSSDIRESDYDKTNKLLLDYIKMMDNKIAELNQPKQKEPRIPRNERQFYQYPNQYVNYIQDYSPEPRPMYDPRNRNFNPNFCYNNYRGNPRNLNRFQNYGQGYNSSYFNYQNLRPNRNNFQNRNSYQNDMNYRNQSQNYQNYEPNYSFEQQNRFSQFDNQAKFNQNKKVLFDFPQQLSNSKTTQGEQRCHNCGKIGHYLRFCPANPANMDNATNVKSNLVYVNTIDEIYKTKPNNLIYIRVILNDREIISLVDTVSEISIIDSNLCNKLNCELIPYDGSMLKAANDSEIEVLGKTFINLVIPGTEQSFILSPKVVKNFRHQMLLGNDFNVKSGVQIDCENKLLSFKSYDQSISINVVDTLDLNNKCLGSEMIHSNKTILLKPNQTIDLKVSASHWRKTLALWVWS